MSLKKAVDKDASADRPSRPTPSHREPVQYNCVEADGAKNVEYTKPQYQRSHELATTSEAKSHGAIVAGKVSGESVKSEPGLDNAKRRFQSIHKRRQETAAVFEANRKKSSTI
jgi:hypothetical protein